jgi:hypothetical protein
MVKRPTGSGGEPSSPNCGASAGVKARQLIFAFASLFMVLWLGKARLFSLISTWKYKK